MRKKSGLTLYKSKSKRHTQATSVKLKEKTASTPQKQLNHHQKRFQSPVLETSSFKRIRIKSPYLYATKIKYSPFKKYSPSVSKQDTQNNNISDNWIDISDSLSEDKSDVNKEIELFSKFKAELLNAEVWDIFLSFMSLVSEKSFQLNNISFLLFLDTVKFFSCKTTTQMSYFTQTKRFWKAGYRLFHGKFIYFMGGPKNVNQENEMEKGYINPQNANINFAVPNVNTIEKFEITDIALPKKMPAGVIEPILQSITDSVTDKRFMLCADAKKVTAGVDKVGGDVDMFGHEDGVSLSQRKDRLKNEIDVLSTVVTDLRDTKSFSRNTIKNVGDSCTIIGARIQEAREMKCRQEYGLNKFLSLGGEKWRESKYIYAISALHTSLYQLNEFVRDALHNVHQLGKCAGHIAESVANVPDDKIIIKGQQPNMVFLNHHYESEIMETMFIVQRTPLWKETRKLSRVTGSTIHNAIGLRGVKTQMKYISRLTNPDDDEPMFTEEATTRMEYGVKNEENALATLSGIVLPTLYPSCCYVEEGCYITQGLIKDVLLVVSPDGSIRECQFTEDNAQYELGKVVAAVEVKCPYPKDSGITIHYSLPRYYVCQCLAEMHALDTNRLIYMSWSEESSVAFEVQFDNDLWTDILNLVSDTYDRNENPKRPKDSGARVKGIQTKIGNFVKTNVRFLGEFPSMQLVEKNLPETSKESPYVYPVPKKFNSETDQAVDLIQDTINVLLGGTEILGRAYELQRRKATEVMIWVLTHVNRDTSTEMPCSVPIAFGLKDYKLTSSAMRNATNYVIKKCQEYGVQICTLSADGQWIQMMTRDKNGNPLTMLQHQKDVWNKAQKLSKAEIIQQIGKLNKVQNAGNIDFSKITASKNEKGVLEIYSKETDVHKIKTPNEEILNKLAALKKRDKTTKSQLEEQTTSITVDKENVTPDWIPQELITIIQDSADHDIQDVINGIDTHLNNNDVKLTSEPAAIMLSRNDDPESVPPENSTSNENVILAIERALKENNLTPVSCTDLLSMLKSEKDLKSLTHKELDLITSVLLKELKSNEIQRKSWKKEKKCIFIKQLFNNESTPVGLQLNKRKKSAPKLSALCEKVIRSRQMPKAVLNVVYASYIYQNEYSYWKKELPSIPLPDMRLDEDDDMFVPSWYSFPEESFGQLIGKSIDCSHNLTHLRVRSCTTGIGEISSEGWRAVAKSNETHLNSALVEDLIDKQSVPNARTNFSEDVESWMYLNGYPDAANVTNIVRNWYEASDTPGISAGMRVQYLLQMRNFLLKDVDFGLFPPPGRYLNKIPTVTFEGLLIDIDTKLQLHALSGPYNIRSVGSLAAETTLGILQQLNPISSVSIKARDVPGLISTVVEVMTCRLNPDRGFFMRTSRKSGIYPVHETDICPPRSNEDCQSRKEHNFVIRNHAFDEPGRKKAKRKIRFGTISAPSLPSRGALPVRQYHRKDESKILPSKRLGIEF